MGFFDGFLDNLADVFKIQAPVIMDGPEQGGITGNQPRSQDFFKDISQQQLMEAAQNVQSQVATAGPSPTTQTIGQGAVPTPAPDDILGAIPGLEEALADAIRQSRPGVLDRIGNALAAFASNNPGAAAAQLLTQQRQSRQAALQRATEIALARETTRRGERTQRVAGEEARLTQAQKLEFEKEQAERDRIGDVEVFKVKNAVEDESFLKRFDAESQQRIKELWLKHKNTFELEEFKFQNDKALMEGQQQWQAQQNELAEQGRNYRAQLNDARDGEANAVRLSGLLLDAGVSRPLSLVKQWKDGALTPEDEDKLIKTATGVNVKTRDDAKRIMLRYRADRLQSALEGNPDEGIEPLNMKDPQAVREFEQNLVRDIEFFEKNVFGESFPERTVVLPEEVQGSEAQAEAGFRAIKDAGTPVEQVMNSVNERTDISDDQRERLLNIINRVYTEGPEDQPLELGPRTPSSPTRGVGSTEEAERRLRGVGRSIGGAFRDLQDQ